MHVAKYGRSSGVTHGIVSAAKETINMDTIAEFKGTFEHAGGLTTVDEWIVVSPPRNLDAFCKPGDSGSWVIEEDTGKLVGLLWGLSGDRTLVSDIKAVFDDIKAKTGATNVEVYTKATE